MRLASARLLIGALLPVLAVSGAAAVWAAPSGHALLIGISRYDPRAARVRSRGCHTTCRLQRRSPAV